MGYSHYLKSESDNWLSDSEWQIFARKAALVVHGWFSKHKGQAIDSTCTTPGIFRNTKDGTPLDPDEIARGIIANDCLCVTLTDGCESCVIDRNEKRTPFPDDEVKYFCFCKTGAIESYDGLVVALFALVDYITDGRISFFSDGEGWDLAEGYSALYDYTGIVIDPDLII